MPNEKTTAYIERPFAFGALALARFLQEQGAPGFSGAPIVHPATAFSRLTARAIRELDPKSRQRVVSDAASALLGGLATGDTPIARFARQITEAAYERLLAGQSAHLSLAILGDRRNPPVLAVAENNVLHLICRPEFEAWLMRQVPLKIGRERQLEGPLVCLRLTFRFPADARSLVHDLNGRVGIKPSPKAPSINPHL